VLRNPPVRIFDEATSALDSANERGTHAELLAANGRYASMWALQQSSE